MHRTPRNGYLPKPRNNGVSIWDREFKLSLFVDDDISLPNLHALLLTYGFISGYKVNTHKTEALPINIPQEQFISFKSNYNYPRRDSYINLGVNISTSYSSLYSSNFPKLLAELHTLMQNLNKLPLSFFGRITAIKMTILPKLLYFFKTLPMLKPPRRMSSALSGHINAIEYRKLFCLRAKLEGGWLRLTYLNTIGQHSCGGYLLGLHYMHICVGWR